MPVQENDTTVLISLANGSSAEIYKYGATVTSWKAPAAGTQSPVTERLFVSRAAILDGSKPIRGGIPIAFPFFGPPSKEEHKAMSQHGFARSERWVYEGVKMDNEAGVSITFKLDPTESIKAVFPHPFSLEYHVTLAVHQLTTRLVVHNTSTSEVLTHQALLHNYFECDASAVTVSPLKGLTYVDKTKNYIEAVEDRDEVDVVEYTDRVYKNSGHEFNIKYPGGGLHLHTIGFNDVVVWNPREVAGRAIADMAEGGWERYICVEPGMASYWNDIQPGGTWSGQQVMTTL